MLHFEADLLGPAIRRSDIDARSWASSVAATARDDPAARLRLAHRIYDGPVGHSRRHAPYRRAALAFMQWQAQRDALNPPTSDRPGSPWWRACNEDLITDSLEALARSAGLGGDTASPTVTRWLGFIADPTPQTWYSAHNKTVVAAYHRHHELASAETAAEQFIINVTLARVLFAHALVTAPRLALNWLAPVGPAFGDPRLALTGWFLTWTRPLPTDFPLTLTVPELVQLHGYWARVVDYGVIVPRLQALYEWSANELDEPGLMNLINIEGLPSYAAGADLNLVNATRLPMTVKLARRVVPPKTRKVLPSPHEVTPGPAI